jgi:cathepsin E
MVPTTLWTTLLLAFAVAAKPISRAESFVKLPVTRRVNPANGNNIVRHDQQRAETLKAKGNAITTGNIKALQSLAVSNAINSPVENQLVSYVATVGVGSPPTDCKSL